MTKSKALINYHRAVKRVTRPMLASGRLTQRSTCIGMELIHMLRKEQRADGVEQGPSAAEQFYALAA